MEPAKAFQLPFLKKEQVAKNTYTFYFDRKDTPFHFTPGQYIRMTLEHENPDERGVRHPFTISSNPLRTDILTVTTKLVEKRSTFKQTLSELQPGQVVQFFGPLGNFVLNESETQSHIFLAGGIGITPYHSMLTYAAEKKLTIPLKLFVSFTTPEEMVFFEELKKIAEESEIIDVIYTVTHPEESQVPWEGEKGRISAELLQKYTAFDGDPLFFVSGPPVMVEAMKNMLLEKQIPEERIREEQFTGY